MKLIICLGNPGAKYLKTRHNTGFMFADLLAKKIQTDFNSELKFKAEIAKGVYNNEALWIIKPQTYMNLSGEALAAIINFYKININDLFLVYDDISLNLGAIRFRSKGSDGGHNGVKSIIHHAGGQNFNRLKIGIGPQPPYIKSEDYVLQNFSAAEEEKLAEVLQKSVEAFLYFCECCDLVKVQNKYN